MERGDRHTASKITDLVSIHRPEGMTDPAFVEVRIPRRRVDEIASASVTDLVVLARREGEIPEHWDPIDFRLPEGRRYGWVHFQLPGWPTAWPLYDREVGGDDQRKDRDRGTKPARSVGAFQHDLVGILRAVVGNSRPVEPGEVPTDGDLLTLYSQLHEWAYTQGARGEGSGRGSDRSDPSASILSSADQQHIRQILAEMDRSIRVAATKLDQARAFALRAYGKRRPAGTSFKQKDQGRIIPAASISESVSAAERRRDPESEMNAGAL